MSEPAASEPRILPRSEHSISRKNINQSTLKVLYRLHKAGHRAYLVGGAVRDLLLDRRPKDFDVATDARPNEVRRLFRNSRVIGRRFRLVHVLFHDGVVEVSTFRGEPDPDHQRRRPGELLVTSDNTFGDPYDDAFRRDFTVNALFYDISEFTVIDYVDGLEDLEKGVIRVIGDADVRFREDPVRMLRACEFAGRLGFAIEPRTQERIYAHRDEIAKAAPARLTEELLQLLRCGNAAAAMQWIVELGLLEPWLPELGLMLAPSDAGDFSAVLSRIDEMVLEEELSDAVLLGAVLAPKLIVERQRLEARSKRAGGRRRLTRLVEETIEALAGRFAISNLKSRQLYSVLTLFQQLCEPIPVGDDGLWLVRREGFPDALVLFELLVRASNEGHEALEAWRQLRQRALDLPPPKRPRRPRRRRRRGGRRRGGSR